MPEANNKRRLETHRWHVKRLSTVERYVDDFKLLSALKLVLFFIKQDIIRLDVSDHRCCQFCVGGVGSCQKENWDVDMVLERL